MDHVTLKSGEIMQKIQLCLLKCIQIEKCIAVFFFLLFSYLFEHKRLLSKTHALSVQKKYS